MAIALGEEGALSRGNAIRTLPRSQVREAASILRKVLEDEAEDVKLR